MTDPIQVTRLPSGLTVVTETMERVETVSLGAYAACGTRNETAAQNGVSHCLEHMAFQGTESRSAAAIAGRRPTCLRARQSSPRSIRWCRRSIPAISGRRG